MRHSARLFLSLLLLVVAAVPALSETVIFQSRLTGNYLAFDRQGLLASIARGPQAQPFELIRLDGNRAAFRDPASGRFLRAGVGQGTHLALGEAHIRAWETFELTRLGGGDVRLRSVQSGAFVGYDGTGPLHARWGTAGAGQTFRMAPVTLPARSPPGAHAHGADLWQIPRDFAFAGHWQLQTIFDLRLQPLPFDTSMVRDVWLAFDRQGAVRGHSGCNGFTAQLMESANVRRIERFLTERAGCVRARLDVQSAFYDAVSSVEMVAHGFDANRRVQRNLLDFYDRNGILRLRFLRRN